MGAEYAYDEQGQYFPYFVMTIAAIITLPLTYSALTAGRNEESKARRITSTFKPTDSDLIESERKRQKKGKRCYKRKFLAVLGWLVILWMIYLILVTSYTVPKVWDPYKILRISRSASVKDIKRHYRRLSLTEHPDKVHIDESSNITAEAANDRWVEVVKAYKALTDDDIRNNYLKYGHPDGKQAFSVGIALPMFIIAQGNEKYVLLLYGGLLAVILPLVVGKWWYGSQRVTRDGVHMQSAHRLFKEYKETNTENDIIVGLSGSAEIENIIQKRNPKFNLKRIRSTLWSSDANLGLPEVCSLKILYGNVMEKCPKKRQSGLCMSLAYLARVDLKDRSLNEDKYAVGSHLFALNESYLAIALAFGNLEPVMASIRLCQHIIQAVLPGDSELLQLPYMTKKTIHSVEEELGQCRSHIKLLDFMKLSTNRRRELSIKSGLLRNREFADAMQIAGKLIKFSVAKSYFRVIGERNIAAASLVHFIIKGRFVPLTSHNVPSVDIEALDKQVMSPEHDQFLRDLGEKGNFLDLAHSPYFGRDHIPKWYALLGDTKQSKIIVGPGIFSRFEQPIFNEQGEPTYAMQTLSIQFGAPVTAGKYEFSCYLLCDSYIGLDSKWDVVLDVVGESEVLEEDVPDSAKRKNGLSTKEVIQDDNHNSSGSEEENWSGSESASSSESETDTETETEDD